MGTGIVLAVLTGLTWTVIGVVLSHSARKGFDLVAYSLTQTFFGTVLAFACYANLGQFRLNSFLILAGLVGGGGLLNAVAQLLVKRAMINGNNGPVWAISQSALIIPFLAGILLWDNHGTLGQWSGTLLIVGGILIPVLGKFHDLRTWLLPTFGAFLLFGIVQTLYAAPSQITGFNDTGGFRPMLASLGGFSGWSAIMLWRKKRLVWNRPTLLLGVIMALLSMVSLKIFFVSLDCLSQAGVGSIGIPLIIGSNILGFGIYSRLILRENASGQERIGMLLVLAGVVVIGF